MSSDWKVFQASKVCGKHKSAMSTGPFGSAISSRFFVNSGVPVIRGGNLSQDVGIRLNHEDLVFITEDKAREFERSTVRHGDLIFTCWGTIDQVGLIDERSHYEEYVISNKQMKITPDPAIADSRFLYYQFSSPKIRSWIIDNGIGSSVPGFNLGMLKSIELNIPQLPEQKAIANILGTLDDKLELNLKTNETLEAMAKALFKSWFVDFDPVRAKAEGSPTGLPAEISDLFPESFEDSELGEIPSGWEIGTIDDSVGEVFDGPHATPKEASEGNVFLGIKNMTGTSLDLTEKRWIGLDDWVQWTKRVVPKSGDIVFTYEAALGLFAVIPVGLKCCLGRRMALVRTRGDDATPYFWFHQFVAEPLQRLIKERSTHGATVNRTPLTEFPSYPVLAPPAKIRIVFESTASILWTRIHLASNEADFLVSLRNALLPKLILGEIRIPDAEKMLEEVGI